jgi:glucose/arabinose dehydrogenase
MAQHGYTVNTMRARFLGILASSHSRSHPLRVALVVGACVVATACGGAGAAPPATGDGGSASGAQSGAAALAAGNLLLVNDRETSNPALVPAALRGFGTDERALWVPPGFSVSVLASGIPLARFMAFDDAGNLLIAAASGSIYRIPGGAAGPVASPQALASGLNAPTSLALHGGYLYVGETTRVSRYPYNATAGLGQRETIVPDLPRGGHQTRTVAFSPDGMLFVSVGSSCNICEESDPRRAAVLRFAADGTGGERFAWGLRNAVGLAFHPQSGELWVTVNERDNQGNEIPPDLVTVVHQGEDFGWPRCQPPNARPQSAGASCGSVTPPTIGIQAHSAPLGLTFLTSERLPTEYRGDLIVAQHGSWNRNPPAAPKLLRIDFEHGEPVRAEDFAAGWQAPDGSRWGRPAGVIAAPDGGLVVSDDTAGLLYRISYSG